MDKTYAETQGKPTIDWHAVIDRLECGNITDAERCDLLRPAFRWVTCACGSQCAIIPRTKENASEGSPIDWELSCLGLQFPTDIETGNYDDARATLAAIEARAAIVVAQELANLNAAP